MDTIVHLTTVHPRFEVRIHIKEAQTLADNLPHKVLVMVADGKGNIDEEQGFVSIYDLGCLGGGRLRRTLIGPWRAFIAIHKIRPAAVHFHDPELIPLGLLLKLCGYKVIYDVHEDVPCQVISKHYLPLLIRKPLAWFIGAVEWFGAMSFNAIVAATPKIAIRFPAKKTIMVQNFPITAEISQIMSVPYAERPLSFAYPGIIATVRGIEEVVRALEYLADIKNARLELAGEFSPTDIQETLSFLPGWRAVSYHGWLSREQLALLLGNVRAGLVLHHPVPNEIDAQPLKMFEYMCASLPIIASDFPLWRRIIEGAGCGLLVDPMNPQEIAKAMRWIIEHPVEAEAMGRRGRQAMEKTYNWDTEATKLIHLYKNLLTPINIK